jgi:hypothetical protein
MTNPVEIFTIRLWREKLDERESEWRGRVQHLGSGQARYFNEISKIAEFIADHLSRARGENHANLDTSARQVGPRIHYPLKKRTRRSGARLDKRPPLGSQPGRRVKGSSFTKPFSTEGGGQHPLMRFAGWIKSCSFPLKKSLVFLLAIFFFVGDWLQVSWLGPRLHSLIAIRPETFVVGLISLPRSLKANGPKPRACSRILRFFQRRRHDKN